MPDLRRLLEEDERREPAEPAPVPQETLPTQLTQVMGLQRSAGNAAVARMLAGEVETTVAALARAPVDADAQPAAEATPAFDAALVAQWEASVVIPAKTGAQALKEMPEVSLPGADDPEAKVEDPPQRETFAREWAKARKNVDVVIGQLGPRDKTLRLRLEVLAATMARVDNGVRLIFGARPSFKWAADACASGHAATVRLGRILRPAGGGDAGAPSAHTTTALIKALFKANVSEPLRLLGRDLARGGKDAPRDAGEAVERAIEHLWGLSEAYSGDPATRDLQLETELLIEQLRQFRDALDVLAGGDPPKLEELRVDAFFVAELDAPGVFGAADRSAP